jgi:hypothetical protein
MRIEAIQEWRSLIGQNEPMNSPFLVGDMKIGRKGDMLVTAPWQLFGLMAFDPAKLGCHAAAAEHQPRKGVSQPGDVRRRAPLLFPYEHGR